jgi:hypothetical protein
VCLCLCVYVCVCVCVPPLKMHCQLPRQRLRFRFRHNHRIWYTFGHAGSASGKTTVCSAISAELPKVALIMLDNFYLPLTPEQAEHVADYDFDSPAALDWPLIIQTLRDVKSGRAVSIPEYCFKTNSRLATSTAIDGGVDVVVVEVTHGERCTHAPFQTERAWS